MGEVMKRGMIECECGNVYFFESIYPEIICMKCGKMNPNNGEIVPPEELQPTEPEEIIDSETTVMGIETDITEETFTLKPCPLCGGAAEFAISYAGQGNDTTYYRVVCTNCSASTRDFYAETDNEGKTLAMDAWNTRV